MAVAVVLLALPGYGATYTVRLLAGSDWIGDGGPARDALLFQAEGVAADRDGNLYVSDAQANRVRQITPSGVIRTVVGTGVAGFAGDGGLATEARLSAPYGLAVDAVGNLFIADLGNRRIRRVGRDGTISTVAGDVPFRAPRNVAVDTIGTLYVSDFESGSVYRIGASGIASVVALLKFPAGLAVDRNGTLYIGETGTHFVRKLEGGAVRTVATVQSPTGLAFDAAGTLHIADGNGGGIFRVPVTGTAAPLGIAARDVALGPSGVLFSTDGRMIRRIVATGNTVMAGPGDLARGDHGLAVEARLHHPSGLALDGGGNLYIADRDNHRIRRVDLRGVITTFAGSGLAGNSGDGGPAAVAALNQPAAVSFDEAGFLYIADQGNGRIRKVSPSGMISAASSMPRPADIFLANLQTDVALPPLTTIIADKNGVLYAASLEQGRVWQLTPPVISPDVATLISIVNAASLTGPLAPGMLARIEGVAFEEVRFDGIVAARVSGEVVVIPAQVKTGTVQVEIGSTRVDVAVVGAAPGLFVAVNEDGSVNDAGHAAERGSALVVYGTGQGVEDWPVVVRIGGYDSEVLYSGGVEGYPGLWQVNVRVPSGFFVPGSLELTVAVGDAVSPALTVQIR
ncbi:MAG: hypothetical protein ABIR70_11370 [Bryobacteraceae bacterium]